MDVLERTTGPAHATPAAASSAVTAVLTGSPQPVRVLAAFPAAVYLEHAAGLLAVVAADGVQHPNAVVLNVGVAARPLAGLRVGQEGTVGDGAIGVGDLQVTVVRWFDPTPHLRATSPGLIAGKVADARSHLMARTGSDTHHLATAADAVADALRRGDAAAAVGAARDLVGAGPGLTPAGDDVLAGLFAAVVTLAPAVDPAATTTVTDTLAAAGVEVVDRARRATTAVSAELLHHAVRGEVADLAAAVLHAFTGRRPLAPALDSLLAVGATSGRDLVHGLITGAALVLAAVDADDPGPPVTTAGAA